MADTTLPGVLLEGDHASRPAANAVASGAIYACSDHALIYQSDGSSWSTYATLGGGAPAAHAASHENGGGDEIDVTGLVGAGGGGGLVVPDLLNSLKGSPDTPDDEFTGTSLDGKWTVVDGSAGSIGGLFNGSGSGVYEVGARDGWLHAKIGTASGDSVILRQDYTLPDGNCIVGAMSFAMDQVTSLGANNEIQFGIGVNDNDTGPHSGTAGQTLTGHVDAEASGQIRAIGWDGTTVLGELPTGVMFGGLWFFRIDRSGLVYRLSVMPLGGHDWITLATKNMSTAANNLWWYAICAATTGNRIVVGSPWFRQGTALALDPWTL